MNSLKKAMTAIGTGTIFGSGGDDDGNKPPEDQNYNLAMRQWPLSFCSDNNDQLMTVGVNHVFEKNDLIFAARNAPSFLVTLLNLLDELKASNGKRIFVNTEQVKKLSLMVALSALNTEQHVAARFSKLSGQKSITLEEFFEQTSKPGAIRVNEDETQSGRNKQSDKEVVIFRTLKLNSIAEGKWTPTAHNFATGNFGTFAPNMMRYESREYAHSLDNAGHNKYGLLITEPKDFPQEVSERLDGFFESYGGPEVTEENKRAFGIILDTIRMPQDRFRPNTSEYNACSACLADIEPLLGCFARPHEELLISLEWNKYL